MLKAISRYGARVAPGSDRIIRECRRAGTLVQGPAIAAFEDAFATRLKVPRAFTASFGRMAFLYLLQALDLPPGSEVIFPALTFWVVPEMARVAGLRPIFADVDPHTLTMDPAGSSGRSPIERGPSCRPTSTACRATWIAIGALVDRHNLVMIEDCAHALGATFRGRAVGTFGRRGVLQLPDAEAAQHLRRRHGGHD